MHGRADIVMPDHAYCQYEGGQSEHGCFHPSFGTSIRLDHPGNDQQDAQKGFSKSQLLQPSNQVLQCLFPPSGRDAYACGPCDGA